MSEEKQEKKTKKEDYLNTLALQMRTLDDLVSPRYNFRVSTGSLKLDIWMNGGYPPGLSRFVGPSELGKTGQALLWGKNWIDFWKGKGKVIYIDAEGRLTSQKIENSGIQDSEYFKSVSIKDKNKVNLLESIKESTFTVIKYNVYEYIASLVESLLKESAEQGEDGFRYFFVFDSLDMFITTDGLEKKYTEVEKVAAAQSISTVLTKKIAPYLSDGGHHIYVISQIRANVDMNNPNSPKTKMSGGNAMVHQSSLTAEIQRPWDGYIYENPSAQSKKDKGKVLGHYFITKWVKTFHEKTHEMVRVPIKYGKKGGIWREMEIVEVGLMYSLFERKGAWVNADETFAKMVNEEITQARIAKFLETEGLKKVPEDKLAELQFTMETKWQGMYNLYSYIETNKELSDFLFDYFKKTLVKASVSERVDEQEEGEDRGL